LLLNCTVIQAASFVNNGGFHHGVVNLVDSDDSIEVSSVVPHIAQHLCFPVGLVLLCPVQTVVDLVALLQITLFSLNLSKLLSYSGLLLLTFLALGHLMLGAFFLSSFCQ